MAYRNMDGRITIDEQVALSDVRKENEAKQILNDAASKLREVIAQTQGYEGDTVRAIEEKASAMLKRTEDLIRNLEQTQNYTKKVVAHYKMIDQQCKLALERK